MLRILAGVVAFSILILPPASAQYSFTELPQFGAYDLVGLSPDGQTILGSTASSPFGVPVYIQNGQSFRLPIGNLGNGIARSMASDGTIVGGLSAGDDEGYEEGAVWRNGQLTLLEHAGGSLANANAVSSDGHVIAGFASLPNHRTQAARWVDGVVQPLGDLPGSNLNGTALAVNADGSVIVGEAAGDNRAFRWMNGKMEALPLINGGDIEDSTAFDVSADGRRIIGTQRHASFLSDALLWEDGLPRNLGYLPGANKAFATAMSSDGGLIFGNSGTGFSFRAYLWDDINGIRDLTQFLADAGVDLHGWQRLTHIRDVSADGRTILGYGENGQGIATYFIATIPEPGTLSLAAAAFALRGLRRRSPG